MDNLSENKFIIINTQFTIFDSLIKDLKDKIYSNNNEEINLTFRKLYNKENEKYGKMIIHAIYNKKIKNIKKFSFSIILDDNFPKHPPKIYCEYLDINNINLNDRRDLLYSIIESKWILNNQNINSVDILENLILIKIPKFISKLLFYEENQILIYYGKYYINEIYNINNFLINKNIHLFKVLTYKNEKEGSKYTELNNKYIIVTDIYILFFDLLNDKTKNLGKLIFIGEIFQFNSIERLDIDINNNIINQNNNINEENNLLNIDPHKIYIDWIINEINYSFIFSLKREINDNEKKNIIKNNNSINEILDFVDIVNKKQNYISSKYKLVINDYNNLEYLDIPSKELTNDKILYNLISLSKYLEKSQQKKINKKKDLKDNNDIYNSEINKIYNKIIDIATKNNKIEITFDFLDKLQINESKRKIFYINEDNEQEIFKQSISSPLNNNKQNPKYDINKNNIKNEKKIIKKEGKIDKIQIKNENKDKIMNSQNKVINNISLKEKNDINKINNNNISNINQNKDNKSNSFYIKNKINNKTKINKINYETNKNIENKINSNTKINKNKNSISALIKMFENKKE